MLSPLDDRYYELLSKTGITECLSEYEYTKNRVEIEIKYLKKIVEITNCKTSEEINEIFNVNYEFNKDEFYKIKNIEKITNHDVKAIEIYLRSIFPTIQNYIHFGLTSQDINSPGFMIGFSKSLNIIKELLNGFEISVEKLIKKTNNITMCAKTHSQFAVPTTLNKEIYCKYLDIHFYVNELNDKCNTMTVKMGGAVGGLNAHYFVYPNIDWIHFFNNFVHELHFKRSEITTQIDNYSNICDIFDCIRKLLFHVQNLNNYCYSLINDKYLCMMYDDNHVGSSTMPQKINPIDFENSKGNIVICTSLIDGITEHLRCGITYQRDMSDSTILRNSSTIFGYVCLIIINMTKAINILYPDLDIINNDLNDNPTIIMEGIQTYLKILNVDDPYTKAKKLSRGKKITMNDIHEFIDSFDITLEHKNKLKSITPQNYIPHYPIIKYFH